MTEEKKVMSFEDCVKMVWETPELIEQYNRLTGSKIQAKRSPLEMMIDDASGYEKAEMFKFFDFVYKYVWLTFLGSIKEKQ